MSERPGASTQRPAILQVLPRLDADEMGRSAVDLARYLRRQGWRTLVASAGGKLERELAAAGGTHVRLPLERTGWLALWSHAASLARLAREHGVGLVHARGVGAAWSAAVAARRARAAFVTTCHEVPLAQGPLPRAARALMRGGRVIAVSDFLGEELTRRGWVEAERVRVVRRWIDTEEFDPVRVRGHRMATLAERWGLAIGTPLLVLPGELAPERGHLLLIEAIARMERRDFDILMAGPGEPGSAYVRELLAKIRAARLDHRVRFGGDSDDLPAILALGDVVVLPAVRPDPSGVLAAAAQAMGKPVIVTDQGALAESVMPAATGWLVPPDDPSELARAIDLTFSLTDDVRERLAARARAYVVDTFGMDAMCARTVEVYRELLRPAEAAQVVPAASAAGAR